MATYIYETIDPKKPARRFELKQSMKDEPLTKHPETGEPIRRVITGGYGYASKGHPPKASDMGGGHGCGNGACGCH
jgi:predicted nucleic acid-binding Zn ribbon protein